MGKGRKPGPWPPSMLAQMHALMKAARDSFEDDEGFRSALDLARISDRRWEISFHAEMDPDEDCGSGCEDCAGHVVDITVPAEWMRGRYRLQRFLCIKDGEDYDLKNDLRNILKVLNPNEYGQPARAAVSHTARGKRNQSVETRRATVIRV